MPAQNDGFRVTIQGPGLSLERSVDQTTALQIISIILNGQALAPVTPEMQHSITSDTNNQNADIIPRPGLAVGEYLKQAEPKSNLDKIATIAGYLKEHLNQETFTKQDIEVNFQKAGHPIPANLARDMRSTVSLGYIAQDPSDEHTFYLTVTGETAVAEKFSKEVRPKRKRAKRPRAKSGGPTKELPAAGNGDNEA